MATRSSSNKINRQGSGHRGREATSSRNGSEFYQKIGRKNGQSRNR